MAECSFCGSSEPAAGDPDGYCEDCREKIGESFDKLDPGEAIELANVVAGVETDDDDDDDPESRYFGGWQ